VVFPHPDDESFATGGLLLKAKKLGFETHLLTLTRGGAGRISINPKGKSLKEIRSEELLQSTRILGVDNLILTDFDDGKLKSRNGWCKVVEKCLLKIKPAVVVTYDPSGATGHPDHIKLCLKVKEIVSKLDQKSRPVLVWTTFYPQIARHFVPGEVRNYLVDADYELKLTLLEVITKFRAILSHRSQRYENLFAIVLGMLIVKKEWYHRVELGRQYPYKYIDFKI